MVSEATRTTRTKRQRLIHNAKNMRHNPTPSEARFWFHAKNRGIGGMKFRRQVPLGPFIADFLCPEQRLVVEIDGGQHGEEEDAKRDAYLKAEGFRVLRFWNSDVMGDIGAVVDSILAELAVPPHPALYPGRDER